jgi:site-specific DNA recombinase
MKKDKISSIEINPDNVNEYEDQINSFLNKSGSGLLESNLFHIYVRVSSKSQEENYSLDNQIRLGKEKGNELSFPLTVIWNERGKSSNSEYLENRKVLTKLFERIKKEKIKNLFVQDMSRLSRNERVSGILKWELEKRNVRLYEKKGTYNFTNPNDKMMFGVLSLFSEHENSIRKMRSVLGKVSKVKTGEWCGGMVGFGYKIVKGERKIDKNESKWVKKIYNWYDEKKTLKFIQSQLYRNGIKTRRGNDIWNTGSITSLLKRTSYIGYTDYTFKTCEEDNEIYKHTYQFPKIIDNNLWKRVQNKIKNSRSFEKMLNGRVRENETLLQTYLVCNGCGKLMGRRKQKGKNVENKNSLYVCRTVERLWNNPKLHIKCESMKSMNIEKTDNLIWNTILKIWKDSYIIKEEFKNQIIDKVMSDRKDMNLEESILSKKNSRDYVIREIKKKENMIVDLENEYYEDKMSKERYDELKGKLLENISKKKGQITETDLVIDGLNDDKKWINWLNGFDEEYHSLSKLTDVKSKKEFLNKFLDKIEVIWDKETKLHTFNIKFRKPIINDSRYKRKKKKFIIKKGVDCFVTPSTKIDRKKYNLRNRTNENELVSSNSSLSNYSTVTDLAKFLG